MYCFLEDSCDEDEQDISMQEEEGNETSESYIDEEETAETDIGEESVTEHSEEDEPKIIDSSLLESYLGARRRHCLLL